MILKAGQSPSILTRLFTVFFSLSAFAGLSLLLLPKSSGKKKKKKIKIKGESGASREEKKEENSINQTQETDAATMVVEKEDESEGSDVPLEIMLKSMELEVLKRYNHKLQIILKK